MIKKKWHARGERCGSCAVCGKRFIRTGSDHRYCKVCSYEKRLMAVRDCAKWRREHNHDEVLKKQREYQRKRRKNNPIFYEKQRISANSSNLRLKIRVLTHYGKRGTLMCCWRSCGISDVDCLSLDHVANDGAPHRKTTGGGGVAAFRWAERAGFPSGFQTLCFNHQMKKELSRRRKCLL